MYFPKLKVSLRQLNFRSEHVSSSVRKVADLLALTQLEVSVCVYSRILFTDLAAEARDRRLQLNHLIAHVVELDEHVLDDVGSVLSSILGACDMLESLHLGWNTEILRS